MRPALVVEDDVSTIAAHTAVLSDLGYHTVAARSIAKAKLIVRNHPCFELVISDLNFADASGHADTQGKEFGEWLKELNYPSITVLHSAHYKEHTSEYIDSAEVFDFQLPLGAKIEAYEAIAETAKEARKRTFEQSKLTISPDAAKKLPSLLEQVHKLKDPFAEENDSNFFEQGYSVISVQPTVGGQVIGAPFFVWEKAVEDSIFLEVYGQPTLLGFGASIDDALRVLNEVMYSTFCELGTNETTGRMTQVIKFLDAVYNPHWPEEIEI